MNERFKLAGFTAVGMLILASVMTGLSASLLDIASEFAIAPSRAGILYTLHFSGFLGLILVSLAVNGLQARLRLVILAAWLFGVALVAAGTSTGFLILAVALIFAGGAGGIIEAHTATLMVMTTKDEGEAGRLISLTQAFFAVGALLTPVYLAMGNVIASSWRSLFLILGGIGVIGGLIGITMRSRRFQFVHTGMGAFPLETSRKSVCRDRLLRRCGSHNFWMGAHGDGTVPRNSRVSGPSGSDALLDRNARWTRRNRVADAPVHRGAIAPGFCAPRGGCGGHGGVCFNRAPPLGGGNPFVSRLCGHLAAHRCDQQRDGA